MNKGQIQIGILVSGFALLASIAAPILWVSNIKETNAVQDNKLANIEENYKEIKDDIKELRKGMNLLLIKNGINPEKIK